MPKHVQHKESPHSAAQMFALVMDVEKYPEFLPWCTGLRIKSNDLEGPEQIVVADMMVGFKMFSEKFTSRVHANHDEKTIEIDYIDGPFKYLHNVWHFEEQEGGGSIIHFTIDFEFKSLALRVLISQVFEEAVKRMVAAFEERATAIYDS